MVFHRARVARQRYRAVVSDGAGRRDGLRRGRTSGTSGADSTGRNGLLHHGGRGPRYEPLVGSHSVPVVTTNRVPHKESLSLPAAGLTCSLHLRIHVLQEIKHQFSSTTFPTKLCQRSGHGHRHHRRKLPRLHAHMARIEGLAAHEHRPKYSCILVGQRHGSLLPARLLTQLVHPL